MQVEILAWIGVACTIVGTLVGVAGFIRTNAVRREQRRLADVRASDARRLQLEIEAIDALTKLALQQAESYFQLKLYDAANGKFYSNAPYYRHEFIATFGALGETAFPPQTVEFYGSTESGRENLTEALTAILPELTFSKGSTGAEASMGMSLAGNMIGSIVPGIGNLVGHFVGLAVGAVVDLSRNESKKKAWRSDLLKYVTQVREAILKDLGPALRLHHSGKKDAG